MEETIHCRFFRFTGDDGLYVSKFSNGNYLSPEKLSDIINSLRYATHPFIAPDESFLIFDAQPQEGNSELFISFRNDDGTWSNPKMFDFNFNTDREELKPKE
jgi:hypothetical protein